MQFTFDDLLQFARWSGDRNPLHVDPEFAAATYFGRPVVHGMLAVGRSVAECPSWRRHQQIDVEFRGALFPDEVCDVELVSDGEADVVSVRRDGEVALRIRGSSADDRRGWGHLDEVPAWVAKLPAEASRRSLPADLAVHEIAGAKPILGRYRVPSDPRTGFDLGLRPQAAVLGLCSYIVGMELPGLRSLFTRARIVLADEPRELNELVYRVEVQRLDDGFRIVDMLVDVASSAGRRIATCELRSYVRFSPVATDLQELAARLNGAKPLEGRAALVCGGSRGLGADIVAALALAGARVFVNYRRDVAAAEALQARLAAMGHSTDLLPGDAADVAWCACAVEAIERSAGRLDLVVLSACGTPSPLRIGPDSVHAFGQYVTTNLSLVQAPLVASLPLLRQHAGRVVYISSSFVDDAPPRFGHYVALKMAGEALVTAAVRENDAIDALILRPPPLQTSWNDTPTSVIGTIPADWVASCLVERLSESIDVRRPRVVTEFPPYARALAPSGLPDDAPRLSLAVAATFTAEPLEAGVGFWCRELGWQNELSFAPYNQVLQALFDPASSLSVHAAGLNVVLVRVQDWLRELPAAQASDAAFIEVHLETGVADLCDAMRAHRQRARAATLLLLCPSSLSALAIATGPMLARAESTLVERLRDVPGLQVVSAADWHARYEVDRTTIDDELRDHIAHVPYHDSYFHVLATLIVRHAFRRVVAPPKVVVVDCDNTLWRGVVGEVDAEGVEFDESHRALHDALVGLSGCGTLVCLCSKNEEDDVWRVFDTRPEMRLRREHIVAAMTNWRPKSENLRELATRLNLGLDSFVFIDDNPVECEEVRSGCPEVLTLGWPTDLSVAVRLPAHAWELDEVVSTTEDRKRVQMYREEFGRQVLRQGTGSFREFLEGLQLVVDISRLTDDDLARASQLTLRTNQFNFTTIRRDEAELRALREAGRHEIRTVRVRDRFGDYGLVGLLVAERGDTSLVIDSFLMSCRVLGRGAEHMMAAELGQIASAHGLPTVTIRVVPTKRNAPARTFAAALCPHGYTSSDGVFLGDVPASDLCDVRFSLPDSTPDDGEPAGGVSGEHGAEGARSSQVDDQTVGARRRRREAQIRRTAFVLSSERDLAAAIEGRPVGVPRLEVHPGREDVEQVVVDAFARSLNRSPNEVLAVDALEALGCDSFRIVEITVDLVQRFPWLPSTLLFEHRSVREIVSHVRSLVGSGGAAPQPSRESGGRVSPVGITDIAVVGLDLRCAGARSAADLWQLLSRGEVAVRPVPRRRKFFFGELRDARPHWAGQLDDVDQFDSAFFGISPREAELMDPQLRLLMMVAWGALEDANAVADGIDSDTGVFVGAMYDDYAHHANRLTRGSVSPYKSWESFSLANRLSQVWGLRGPSLTIDTACSSSATALHVACRALADDDCRVGIVGGVNLVLDPDRFVQLGRLGILSPTGRCLAFGNEADGTLLGEGAGVIVLRRLDDALERGDRIYGVIKGTGVSTGSGTVGFTAPNPQAQAVAIRRALAAARVEPASIAYVETHGTGTLLGDPIEVRGLMLGYVELDSGPGGPATDFSCRIGSIKPNIGHLEAGAGVMGLIKVLLQLHHGRFVPSVTSDALNSQIPFGAIPFDVQRASEPWEARSATPRRAALSSFGVGGANAHVIVEEAPSSRPASSPRSEPPLHVVTLSARSEAALQRQARSLREFITREAPVSLGALGHTLNATRRRFEHRAALVVGTLPDLAAAADQLAEGRADASVIRGHVATEKGSPRVAFLFTGQGAQYHGMGRQLYERHPAFREAMDQCAKSLDGLLPVPLVSLLYDDEPEADRGRLDQTGYTQPALFAIEYALARLWQSWGVEPSAVMGHSVGEFAAMCIAGGLDLDDAARLVEARGRLMQALPPGGVMVSVAATEGAVRDALAGSEDRASVAAINGPEQIVISGEAAAVASVVGRLAAGGVRTTPLTVSHAFHSPLMRPMVDAYADVVRQVRFRPPAIPIVGCVDGVVADETMVEPGYWVRQVLEPVRFTRAIETMRELDVSTFIEIGPQPVLIGLGRRCLIGRDEQVVWLPSLKRDADDWATMLSSLARLHVDGVPVDWRAFGEAFDLRQAPAPHYAFDTKRHWVAVPASYGADPTTVAEGAGRPPDSRAYQVGWYEALRIDIEASEDIGRWVVVGGDRTAEALAVELRGRGGRCEVVPGEAVEDVAGLADALRRAGPLRGVVSLHGADGWADAGLSSEVVSRWREGGVGAALRLAQAAAVATVPVWLVTRGAVGAGGETPSADAASVLASTLWGFGRSLALERPECWGGLVDLPGSTPTAGDAAWLADALTTPGGEDQIAIRAGRRFVPRLQQISVEPTGALVVSSTGVYLVTGGLGALGLRVARWLIERGAKHLVLVGRHPGADAAIQELRQLGATVAVERADVSVPGDLDRLMSRLAAGALPLRGVVHAAGVDRPVAVQQMTREDLETALSAKVDGAWLLHDRTRNLDLDFFVVFSSLASVLGASGRAHYAAANAFLDALAGARHRGGARALAVNWGPWAGPGMAADEATSRQFEAIGNHLLDPDEALALLEGLIVVGTPNVVVADIDWATFRPVYEARRPRPLISQVGEAGEPIGRAPAGVAAAASEAEFVALVRQEAAQVLGFADPQDVAVDRDLFDLGLDSLSSVELATRLRQRFGVECQDAIFGKPTVVALAAHVWGAMGREPETVAQSADTVAAPAAPATVAAEGVVTYAPDLAESVFEFHAQAFPRRRTDWVRPRWQWMFVESANRLGRSPLVWLYRDQERIVGHNGAMPVQVKIGDQVRESAWLVETSVLQAYRHLAVGPRLMAAAHDGVPFALSLGQTETMRAIQLRMGWHTVAPLHTAQLLVRPERVFQGKLPGPAAAGAGLGWRAWSSLRRLAKAVASVSLRSVDVFDARHDQLWNVMAADVPCAVVRDASYLNWKYVAQPGQEFIRFDTMLGESLLGTSVWMVREPDQAYVYRRAFLVDFVAPLTDVPRLVAIIQAGCTAMAERGADAVVCLHAGGRLSAALEYVGFLSREPERFLLVYPGELDAADRALVLDERHWFITQGDSDIDRPW